MEFREWGVQFAEEIRDGRLDVQEQVAKVKECGL